MHFRSKDCILSCVNATLFRGAWGRVSRSTIAENKGVVAAADDAAATSSRR
jgi:hypothetical protein